MIKDNSKRAQSAAVLFKIMLGITLISIIAAIMQLYSLRQINDEYGYGQAEAEFAFYDVAALLSGFVGLVSTFFLCFSIIYFIKWFRRAYYNLHVIKTPGLSHSEGWAAAGWFVPFMNLYVPYQIMRDLWTNYGKAYIVQNPSFYSGLAGFWWLFFLISRVAGNIAMRLTWGAESIRELKNAATAYLISDLVDLPGLILTIVLIKIISAQETYEHVKWQDAVALSA